VLRPTGKPYCGGPRSGKLDARRREAGKFGSVLQNASSFWKWLPEHGEGHGVGGAAKYHHHGDVEDRHQEWRVCGAFVGGEGAARRAFALQHVGGSGVGVMAGNDAPEGVKKASLSEDGLADLAAVFVGRTTGAPFRDAPVLKLAGMNACSSESGSPFFWLTWRCAGQRTPKCAMKARRRLGLGPMRRL